MFWAGFEVAVAAEADKNLSFVWFFYPVAILLEGLVRALQLSISTWLNLLFHNKRFLYQFFSRFYWLYFFGLLLHSGFTIR